MGLGGFLTNFMGSHLQSWNNISIHVMKLCYLGEKIKLLGGFFLVESLYNEMMLNEIGYPQNFMWKAKIPQKIEYFCGSFEK